MHKHRYMSNEDKAKLVEAIRTGDAKTVNRLLKKHPVKAKSHLNPPSRDEQIKAIRRKVKERDAKA